jgi:hypothetical protein
MIKIGNVIVLLFERFFNNYDIDSIWATSTANSNVGVGLIDNINKL